MMSTTQVPSGERGGASLAGKVRCEGIFGSAFVIDLGVVLAGDPEGSAATLYEVFEALLIGRAHGFQVVVIEDDKLRVVESGGQGFRRARNRICWLRGRRRCVLRCPRDLRRPRRLWGGGRRPRFRSAIRPCRGRWRRPLRSMAPAALRLVRMRTRFSPAIERDLVGADGLAFGGEFDRGFGGARGVDGEVDREVLAGEDGAGDADGFGLELGLSASAERDGVDGDAKLLSLPGGAGGGAIVLIAVGQQQRCGGWCRRGARRGLRGWGIRGWCRGRRHRRCAEDADWLLRR